MVVNDLGVSVMQRSSFWWEVQELPTTTTVSGFTTSAVLPTTTTTASAAAAGATMPPPDPTGDGGESDGLAGGDESAEEAFDYDAASAADVYESREDAGGRNTGNVQSAFADSGASLQFPLLTLSACTTLTLAVLVHRHAAGGSGSSAANAASGAPARRSLRAAPRLLTVALVVACLCGGVAAALGPGTWWRDVPSTSTALSDARRKYEEVSFNREHATNYVALLMRNQDWVIAKRKKRGEAHR